MLIITMMMLIINLVHENGSHDGSDNDDDDFKAKPGS